MFSQEHRWLSLDPNSLQQRHARFGRFGKTPPPNMIFAYAAYILVHGLIVEYQNHDRVNLALLLCANEQQHQAVCNRYEITKDSQFTRVWSGGRTFRPSGECRRPDLLANAVGHKHAHPANMGTDPDLDLKSQQIRKFLRIWNWICECTCWS